MNSSTARERLSQRIHSARTLAICQYTFRLQKNKTFILQKIRPVSRPSDSTYHYVVNMKMKKSMVPKNRHQIAAATIMGCLTAICYIITTRKKLRIRQ